MFCFLLIELFPGYVRTSEITTANVITHLFLLGCFIMPLVYLGNKIDIKAALSSISEKSLHVFSLIVIVTGIMCIILSFPMMVETFMIGDFREARGIRFADGFNTGFSSYGIWGIIASIGANTYFPALILFFYYLITKKSKIMTALLFTSSLSIVVMNLAIAGRDGIFRYGLLLLFAYITFKNDIKVFHTKKTKIIISSLLMSAIAIFYIISQSRFESSDQGVVKSLLDYAGQPFYNFSYYINRFSNQDNPITSILPIFSSGSYEIKVINTNISLNTFGTIVGSFIVRIGTFYTFIICVIHSVDIVMTGFFYYMQATKSQQFSLIGLLVIAFILQKLSYKNKRLQNIKMHR